MKPLPTIAFSAYIEVFYLSGLPNECNVLTLVEAN
jgi:hypothetical protein